MMSISRTALAVSILIEFAGSAVIAADVSAATGETSRPTDTVREIHIETSAPADLMHLIDDSGNRRAESDAAQPFSVRVTLDARKPLHAISSLIYGASAVEPARAKLLGVSAGGMEIGNRSSRQAGQGTS